MQEKEKRLKERRGRQGRAQRKSGGGYYVDVIQKRERMLHLLKRLPRKIAVSRMATSLAVAGALSLPPQPSSLLCRCRCGRHSELRRVYIQFVSRNYNLSGIGA